MLNSCELKIEKNPHELTGKEISKMYRNTIFSVRENVK